MKNVEEFINKVVNDDLVRNIDECLMDVKLDEYLKEVRIVSDEYDQKQEYGLYEGDSENARNHLLNTLSMAYQKGREESAISEFEYIVRTDLKNWLSCIDIFEYDEELPKVFSIMVCLGFGEIVCEQVEAEYTSFIKSLEDLSFDNIWIPDYAKLYMKCADYCLFSMANAKLARRFYHLAILDWYGILDGNSCKRNFQPSKEQKAAIEKNDRIVSELDHYYNLLELRKAGRYKKVMDAYNACLREKNSKYIFSDMLLECLLEFVNARDKCWNSCSRDFKRIFLIISHRLREEAIADIIVVLCKEDISLETKERLLNWVKNSHDARLSSAHRLVERFGDDGEILKVVNMLMKANIQIREVLLHLKVNNIKNWEKPLAYYTSLDTFCYMLPDWNKVDPKGVDRFSIMNIAYMNDPTEGKMLQQVFQQSDKSGFWGQYLSRIKGQRTNIEYPYVFMKCFTSLVDDLPMWEMYGDKAKGCCVILDPQTFCDGRTDKTIGSLYQICYICCNSGEVQIAEQSDTEKHDSQNREFRIDTDSVKEALMQLRDIGVQLFQKEKNGGELYYRACIEFISMLDQIRFLFKSADYKHEQEMRLLYVYLEAEDVFLHTNEKWPKLYIRPDFAVKIREIIIGPKCLKTYKFMPYLQEQIAKMYKVNADSELPKITMSGIQYQ